MPPHFDLADTAGTGAFAGWRSALGDVFAIGAGPGEIGSFQGKVSAWSASRFVLSEISASRVQLLRSLNSAAQSPIDHFAIQLVEVGTVAGLVGSRDVDCGVDDVLFIDLSQSAHLQLSGRGGNTTILPCGFRAPGFWLQSMTNMASMVSSSEGPRRLARSSVRACDCWLRTRTR